MVTGMNRRELVVATLAAAGEGATFTPVQVQKIFFLVDVKASHLVGGKHFNFQPYDYGPFDNAVYEQLEILARRGVIAIEDTGRYKAFSLTDLGFAEGYAVLTTLPQSLQEFLRATVAWVRRLRFDQLVAAIYREYPDMKARSIFNQ